MNEECLFLIFFVKIKRNIQQPGIDQDSLPQIEPPLKMFTADMDETFGLSKPVSQICQPER
ncbi:hypothetical protein C0J52_17222 [Blattella germanica]|nr:hypothetical protein C0J52_17222 [Blattella germanica]